jgi:hypothetical protein
MGKKRPRISGPARGPIALTSGRTSRDDSNATPTKRARTPAPSMMKRGAVARSSASMAYESAATAAATMTPAMYGV